MISVNTKLTLWILALPISVLILSDVVMFYNYQASEVSASIAAIAVLLLVWERLRDSLSKKLEYLHGNYLLKLYQSLQYEILNVSHEPVKRIRTDLGRYGKFMGISLYPRNLLKTIDRFLITFGEFENRLSEVMSIGRKCCDKNLDRHLWLHSLEIKRLKDWQHQRYNGEPIFKLYADKASVVRIEQVKLIEETKNLFEEGEKMRKEIFEKLEHFFKSHSLSLKAEPPRM